MIDHLTPNRDQSVILIVDDTQDSLALLGRILEENGYLVRGATNGRHALKSVAARLPDLILLDVKMPGMDGYEVCRRLKAAEHSRDLPVIFISAYGETAEKVHGFKVGAVDFITKPYEEQEVLARVHIHLRLRELTEHLEQKVAQRTEALHSANARLQRELAERKRAEQALRRLNAQLEAASKEMHAFTYTVSHDLRAPLRHIDGFVELLQQRTGTTSDEQCRHYMDNISDAAQKMGRLIDDLLTFSRMGRHGISFKPVELGPLVQDVIGELGPDAAGRDVQWSIGDLPPVDGDAPMLRMVLFNLVANALKFTRSRPQARIEIGSLPQKEGEVVIFVRDNGVGFDMTYADKLFGVFQRLHRAEEFEGTGIGLATVQRIIDRHGGRVWAEGAVDQGATFYVSLPQQA